MQLITNSKKITKAREAIYNNIRENEVKPSNDEGILLRFKLNNKDILPVQKNVKKIIMKSLKIFHKKKIQKCKKFFTRIRKRNFSITHNYT